MRITRVSQSESMEGIFRGNFPRFIDLDVLKQFAYNERQVCTKAGELP